MGSVYPDIDDERRAWLQQQPMFFVATAPSGDDGHLNLSPKGGSGTLAVLGPLEVAYLDLFGSGIETVAHLRQNGRIVVMFCAFDGPPQILRLHGHGVVVEPTDPGFAALRSAFDVPPEVEPAIRSIIRIEVTRVSDSCGFVVPQMSYEHDRRQLYQVAGAWIRQRGPDAIREYCDVNNQESIDGLPALTPSVAAVSAAQRELHGHEGRKL